MLTFESVDFEKSVTKKRRENDQTATSPGSFKLRVYLDFFTFYKGEQLSCLLFRSNHSKVGSTLK